MDKQVALVMELVDAEGELIARGLTAWRASELNLHAAAGGAKVPFVLEPQTAGDPVGLRLIDGKPLTDAAGESFTFNASNLTPVDNSSKLRKAIRTALDLFAIANRDPRLRRDAVTKLGQARVLCEGTVDEVRNNERVIEVYLGRKKKEKQMQSRNPCRASST